MKNKPNKFYSLSRRFVVQSCLFTLALSAVYGVISILLMYTLEDSFIHRDMQQEATYLTSNYQKNGEWPATRKSSMQLHFSRSTFPQDFRALSIQEPKRREFYGNQGRHYHLFALEGHQDAWLVAEVSDELLVRPIREGVIKFLIISTLFVSILACLLTWLLSRKTVKPLKQLADLVDGVAPENMPKDFAKQFPNNEIGILARTLEQSLARIAQALEREKCFTRDVSHELRTPLAIVQNAAELYDSYQIQHQPADATVKRIADASKQMEKTVYTLLMLAREEHSRSAKESTPLLPTIERSILDNHSLLDGKQIDINIDDNCKADLYAQPDMLKVLVDNLLSNAFRYTLEGEVSIQFKDGTLLVKDTGPGIEETISKKVTEPAIKGSQSTGFGFGLSIVKRLCEHQGWQLTVESDNGTQVSIKVTQLKH